MNMKIRIDRKLADGDRIIESPSRKNEFDLDNVVLTTVWIVILALFCVAVASLPGEQIAAWFQGWWV